MGRKRNSLGQFTYKDTYNTLYVEIPGPLRLFKYFLVFLAISPWIFVLFFRVDIKSIFKGIIEKNPETVNCVAVPPQYSACLKSMVPTRMNGWTENSAAHPTEVYIMMNSCRSPTV